MSQMKLDHDTEHAVNAAVALVNTHDTADARDDLLVPEDLRRILVANGYSNLRPISAADLKAVRAVRERLRTVFAASDEEHAVELLDDLVVRARALPRLVRHDGTDWHFHYTDDDTSWGPRLASDLAMGLLVVIRDLGFRRLGVCASDTCDDVFVDLSRNASKRYCDPRSCGNRAAVRAYRARQGE